jgi:hypothetical protein
MAKSKALGTILKQASTVVANITSISIPGPTKTEIDVTDFASVAVETLAGMPDYGEVTFSGFYNYSDAGQTIVRADAFDVAAGTKAWFVSEDFNEVLEDPASTASNRIYHGVARYRVRVG